MGAGGGDGQGRHAKVKSGRFRKETKSQMRSSVWREHGRAEASKPNTSKQNDSLRFLFFPFLFLFAYSLSAC